MSQRQPAVRQAAEGSDRTTAGTNEAAAQAAIRMSPKNAGTEDGWITAADLQAESMEPESAVEFKPIVPKKVEVIHQPEDDAEQGFKGQGSIEKGADGSKALREERFPEESMPAVDLQFVSGPDNGRNSNERILELHKAGKSNMAIAKELGLGLGEVKLVIDLFEGM